MPNSRLYSIQITDAGTDQVVIFAAADWTEEQKRVVVAQIARLVGIPPDSDLSFLAESGLTRATG
jgi:hypothetical protein